MTTRAKLQPLLDTLKKSLPAMVREHPDDGDFWATFAGASDFILDDAGPEDYDWALAQIDKMLDENGKLDKDIAPSDDLPP